MKKIIFITLVLFSLALSSLMAWPVSPKTKSGTTPLLEDLVTKPTAKAEIESTKPSTICPNTSDTVEIPRDVFQDALTDLEVGTEEMDAGYDMTSSEKDAAIEAYENLKRETLKPRFFYKIIGEWNPLEIRLGLSSGLVIKNTLIAEVGVLKKDLKDWSKETLLDLNSYSITFGVGAFF